MKHLQLSTFVALSLLAVAAGPLAMKRWEAARIARQLTGLGTRADADRAPIAATDGARAGLATPDPALVVRVEAAGGLVASWQTVGGCGAGSGGGSSIGLKWIGRNVHGGLFNVQEQASYTKIGQTNYPEYNFFFNTLITRDLGERWNVGVNLPFIYKYLVDPQHLGGPGVAPVDYSNAGLGDIGLLGTFKFGRIRDLALTLMIGLPTGTYDASFTKGGTPLNQSQQIGFGCNQTSCWIPTTSLTLEHTLDQVWGLVVVGGNGSWRGGTNRIHNYRAPSGTGYGYVGYFLGPLVPAIGLSVTGYTGHDRDQDAIMRTPLFSMAANLSLEWSGDWIALLVAASIPYGYDGIKTDESGLPRSPWGFLPWTAAFGIAASPF